MQQLPIRAATNLVKMAVRAFRRVAAIRAVVLRDGPEPTARQVNEIESDSYLRSASFALSPIMQYGSRCVVLRGKQL